MRAHATGGWDEVATKTDVVDLRAELREFRAEMRESMSQMVTRTEFSEQLQLHVEASVGKLGRWWMFSTMAMQAATIGGVIAAVRL